MQKVIVIGGGVGGLTAAHELADRGFEVHVYEARRDLGGKARSQPVPGSGRDGRADLPGEHGFRFYPRFYEHVIDTMKRIPSPAGGTVAQHLKATTESAIALVDRDTWYRFSRQKLARPYEVIEALQLFFQELDFDSADFGLFFLRILQFMTSCDERRLHEYERMSWWDYLDGDRYSPKFQRQLRAVPRTMVAMDPRRGSARTIGKISTQLILDYADTGVSNDRTMGGPTTEMWIDPWVAHLKARGVAFHAGAKCVGLDVSGGRISGVRFDGAAAPVVGDHYVLAVPIDVAHELISPELAQLDPALGRLRRTPIDRLVSWMVGIQFFLYEDVPLVQGHVFYPDSPWALTSISQPQFWREQGLFRRRYGDGSVGGLISVDVSDWDVPGHYVKKPARECSPAEIKHEIWEHLKAALNGEDKIILSDDLLHSWHLDDDLVCAPGRPTVNGSRLLVHPPGSWAVRPEAESAIPNLCLAGDYIRTDTDLASMEGANEAGRMAANVILKRCGRRDVARLWPMREPARFEERKLQDLAHFRAGRPHRFEQLGLRRAFGFADTFRKFADVTGLAAADDFLDQYRFTVVFARVLRTFGVRQLHG